MCVRLVVSQVRLGMYTSIHQVCWCIHIGTSYRFCIHRCLRKYQASSSDTLEDIDSDKFHHNWEYKSRPGYRHPVHPVDTDLERSFIRDNLTVRTPVVQWYILLIQLKLSVPELVVGEHFVT